MKLLVITGEPNIGKTTAVMKVADMLRDHGYNVGGIISREVRRDNRRIGFEFIDLGSGKSAILSSITGKGPRVGKYFVSLEGCLFAVEKLYEAMSKADVIICDEVGPMEFKSEEFITCVKALLAINKTRLVVLHKRLRHPVIDKFRESADLLLEVTMQNRNKVPEILLQQIEGSRDR